MRVMRRMGIMGLMRLMGPMGPMGLMGLIMLLSGCCSHSDDTPEPTPLPSPGPVVETGTPISFSGRESESQEVSNGVKGTRAETRAATPLSEKTTTFTVWGYKNMTYDSGTGSYDTDPNKMQEVFPGYTVNWQANSAATTTTNTNGWEYILLAKPDQTIKYWDWSAKAYRYFAVTGLAAAYSAFAVDGTYGASYPTKSFTVAADATPVYDAESKYDAEATAAKLNATPYFTRLWFSTGDIGAYPDKQFGLPVQLEFLKPYARVRFIFKYSYPREGIKLSEKSFKPTTDCDEDLTNDVGIARKGTVTVIYPLTGTATEQSYSVARDDTDPKLLAAFTEDYDLEDDAKVYTQTDNGWYMVLPTLSQGSYTLSVKVNNEAKTCSVPAEYMRWLPGYSYTYIFKILEEGGVAIELVQAAVTSWTDMNADRRVYNW